MIETIREISRQEGKHPVYAPAAILKALVEHTFVNGGDIERQTALYLAEYAERVVTILLDDLIDLQESKGFAATITKKPGNA